MEEPYAKRRHTISLALRCKGAATDAGWGRVGVGSMKLLVDSRVTLPGRGWPMGPKPASYC